MGKNYEEISNQVAVVQTSNHTLAFYANLETMKEEKFGELITGKIKVLINDFSKGRGDNAICAYYNLELKHIYYLYHRATFCNMPAPLYDKKIHGAFPIEEGTDKGKCRAFHISISRNPVRKDGSVSRNPWNITIENGVAVAQKGSTEGTYYEKEGTFEKRAYTYINLSDVDFLECMEKINAYISNYRAIAARYLIPKGLKLLNAVRNRGAYQEDMTPDGQHETPTSDTSTAPTEETSQPPAQPETQKNTTPEQTPPAQQPAETPAEPLKDLPELHPTTILITSAFQALEDGKAIAECLAKGRVYTVFFDSIVDKMVEAQEQQVPITVNLYLDAQKRFHCYNVAA